MNWQELAATSHYQTAMAVENRIMKHNIKDATVDIRELIEALGRSEKSIEKSAYPSDDAYCKMENRARKALTKPDRIYM